MKNQKNSSGTGKRKHTDATNAGVTSVGCSEWFLQMLWYCVMWVKQETGTKLVPRQLLDQTRPVAIGHLFKTLGVACVQGFGWEVLISIRILSRGSRRDIKFVDPDTGEVQSVETDFAEPPPRKRAKAAERAAAVAAAKLIVEAETAAAAKLTAEADAAVAAKLAAEADAVAAAKLAAEADAAAAAKLTAEANAVAAAKLAVEADAVAAAKLTAEADAVAAEAAAADTPVALAIAPSAAGTPPKGEAQPDGINAKVLPAGKTKVAQTPSAETDGYRFPLTLESKNK